jgi:hypothetical protein
MMEAARTSETLVNFCQTTRRYNPEDSHLCTHRRENLKSYLIEHLIKSLKKKNIRVVTGLNWLMIGYNGGSCKHSNESSGSIKGGEC